MRALVLSDVHGNLHALEAVLAFATEGGFGGYDALWNLGDVVGYGARPNEVIALLRALAAVNVRGNHDRVCCGATSAQGFNPIAAQAAAWTRRHLTPENTEWLRSLPQGPVRATERATCAHGSPLHEDHYIVSMRDAWTPLQRMETPVSFFGHTHVQGGFSQLAGDWEEDRPVYAGYAVAESAALALPVGTRHLLNPGSVGQPRDGDWRACFALYEETDAASAAQVTFYRIPYDVTAAQAAIRAACLPERLAARLSSGK